MSRCKIQRKGRWHLFSTSSTKKILKQRYDWIQKLNKQCKEITSENLQPVVFLFFDQAEQAICDQSNKCFSLTEVDQNAFTNWLVFVGDILTSYGAYRNSQLFTYQNQYETQLENHLQDNKLKFPLSYQQFYKHTKIITEPNNSDHE